MKTCCTDNVKFRIINGLTGVVGLFNIGWFGHDLIIDNKDRSSSDYIGLGSGFLFLGLSFLTYRYAKRIRFTAAEAMIEAKVTGSAYSLISDIERPEVSINDPSLPEYSDEGSNSFSKRDKPSSQNHSFPT